MMTSVKDLKDLHLYIFNEESVVHHCCLWSCAVTLIIPYYHTVIPSHHVPPVWPLFPCRVPSAKSCCVSFASFFISFPAQHVPSLLFHLLQVMWALIQLTTFLCSMPQRNLAATQKYSNLMNHFKPSSNFKFPRQYADGCNRSCQYKYFAWFAIEDGIYSCFLLQEKFWVSLYVKILILGAKRHTNNLLSITPPSTIRLLWWGQRLWSLPSLSHNLPLIVVFRLSNCLHSQVFSWYHTHVWPTASVLLCGDTGMITCPWIM